MLDLIQDLQMEEASTLLGVSLGEASRKKNEGPFFKKPKTSADCTLVQARPREPPINGTVKANPVESIDNKKTRGESEKSTKDILDGRNVPCPIPERGTCGGRGYRREGISQLLVGQRSLDLVKRS